MMNKSWIGERVAVVDIDRAIRNVVLEQDDFGWGPNNRFKFPLKGGTGEFYRRIGETLKDKTQLTTTVRSIDVDRKVVTFTDGSSAPFDSLLSTMPLDVLCRDILAGQVPQHIRDTAARLRHSSGY